MCKRKHVSKDEDSLPNTRITFIKECEKKVRDETYVCSSHTIKFLS